MDRPDGAIGPLTTDDAHRLPWLVIGVHREELPFGDRVVSTLSALPTPPRFTLLRIAEGLSGRHPRADQVFRQRIAHRELYHQIAGQIAAHAEGCRLVIDLHQGFDDNGPCADLISADGALLAALRDRMDREQPGGVALDRQTLRYIALSQGLSGDDLPDAITPLTGHTAIPHEIWAGSGFRFVIVEIYLTGCGCGNAGDWQFAARVLAPLLAAQRNLPKARE